MNQGLLSIIDQKQIAYNIYELILSGPLVRLMNTPGQFLHIKIPREDLLLRRPLSIASIDTQKEQCTLIYRIEGVGTERLSQLPIGSFIDVLGPLGQGFAFDHLQSGDHAFIFGGGIGIPPLYELTKQLHQKGIHTTHFLGYNNQASVYYESAFNNFGPTYIATDDGSYGILGHVGTLLEHHIQNIIPDSVFACGPNGLLKMIASHYSTHPQVQLSLEARMACGIGACYACVCYKDVDKKDYVKVCDQGPVFQANEVCL